MEKIERIKEKLEKVDREKADKKIKSDYNKYIKHAILKCIKYIQKANIYNEMLQYYMTKKDFESIINSDFCKEFFLADENLDKMFNVEFEKFSMYEFIKSNKGECIIEEAEHKKVDFP